MSTTPTDDSSISFSDYLKPTLAGGSYTIKATQTVTGRDKSFESTQDFLVRAPQFSIEPKEIHTHYPAHGAVEDYATHLPYIVLTRRALPWERTLNGSETPPIPWVALMLFTEEEVSPTLTMEVGAFFTEKRTKEIKIKDDEGNETTVTKEIHAFVPKRTLFQEVDDAAPCQCIEVPVDVFTDLAPRMSELPCLAHTRTVAMANKADVAMPHQGAFSIVIANRLPTPGKKHHVHLVSLQGCTDYVEGNVTDVNKKQIRLISLAGWSFECVKGADSFEKIVANLIKEKEHLLLRLHLPAPEPTEEQDKAAKKALDARLERGYVPLPFHVMDGRDSFAWYRGPLTPVTPDAGQRNQAAFLSASSAMAFDEATGVFDLSDAAAWQLGRLLALADPAFGIILMDLRRKFHHELDTIFDQLKDRLNADESFAQADADEADDLVKAAAAFKNQMDALIKEEEESLGGVTFAAAADRESALSDKVQALFSKTAIAAFGEWEETVEASGVSSFSSEGDPAASFLFGNLDSIETDGDGDFDSFAAADSSDAATPMDVDVAHYVDQFAHFLTFVDPEPEEEGLFSESSSDPNRAIMRQAVEAHLLAKYKADLRTIVGWLNQLSLMDIPFYYVLPHPGLVPAESLRFFHVDRSWWYALYDGAISLGLHARIDEVIYHILKDYLRHPEQIKEHLDIDLAKSVDQWGILLRSKLVKAWSGVEFYAYKGETSIKPVVTQKIGDDLLLFLFDHRPDRLILQMPKEGLRFALKKETEKIKVLDKKTEKEKEEERTYMHLTPKHIGGNQSGISKGKEETVRVPFRQKVAKEPPDSLEYSARRVIDVDALLGLIKIKPGDAQKAAALAIHLIDTNERFILTQ